jgi:MEDS: MEthanogen/methylotroph, DcmR Sensory domain
LLSSAGNVIDALDGSAPTHPGCGSLGVRREPDSRWLIAESQEPIAESREPKVPRRSIHLCGQEIEQPGHICAFFTSREEEYQTLIPYLRDGVEAGEQVLNVLDEDRLRDHRERLEAGGVATNDGDVQIASSEQTYLAGGHFDMTRMVGFVREQLVNAATRGRCVRTAGWMDWMYRNAPGTERAMEYEARMNLLVPTFDCTFMCVYDLTRMPGNMVIDIMATHPYVILDGRIRQNSFYVPPDIYLRELLSRTQRGTGPYVTA